MAEAARRAPMIERPTWLMARRQTAGRGRRGRAWVQPDGNFAATFVYKPDMTAAQAALRSFSTANALFEVMSEFVDHEKLALKWPNDVLYEGGKAAGILLESAGGANKLDWLSIGIGVNLVSAPNVDETAFPPVSLPGDITPDAFLDKLAPALAAEEARFAKGFGVIRDRWLSRAAKLGETITARTGKDDISGTFETVDNDGQLVLMTPKGQVRIPAADVYF